MMESSALHLLLWTCEQHLDLAYVKPCRSSEQQTSQSPAENEEAMMTTGTGREDTRSAHAGLCPRRMNPTTHQRLSHAGSEYAGSVGTMCV
ncbi:unnamed protein product [Leuciscus chuanchicus]